MRKLTTLVALAVVIAIFGTTAWATPAADTTDPVSLTPVADDGEEDKDGDGEEAKKEKRRHSSRDKWARGKGPAKSKSKPKYKKWDEVLKDAEKHEGLFEIHTKSENAWFAIKEEQLDKPFIAFMSLSKGIGARFVLGGLPLSGSVMFDFHRVEDHIQLRMLNTRFRATDDAALDEAIDLSYGNSVMFSLPIASENKKDKALLVSIKEVFLSDVSDMGFFLQLVLKKPVRMDKDKGIFRKIKTFPTNVEIEALLTYSPGDRRGLHLPQVPDSRFIEIGVHYSIHQLPEEPMKPRLADDRVGYFMTPFKDFSRDSNESFFVHHINRWRLEKEDPSASMSEPKKPIVFYLDTTIPEEYRPFVTRGIEMWQKAYEAAGFKNAIIAKEVGEDPEYDAEDARYNTIRWIISDEPSFGAIGPSRVDPRTGEILDADILMEQNMIASFRKAYRRYGGPDAFLKSDPMLQYMKDPSEDPERALQMELQKRFLGHTCDMANGFMNNFEFAQLAILADGMGSGMDVPKEFTGEAIMFVTAHEVGHTLGLRHNFESSRSTPYSKLHDKAAVEEIGMTGSVMDYASPNVSRNRAKQGYYYTPSVGTYDQWAIQYGYSEIPGDRSTKEENEALMSIANRASEKQHAYGTDEDTYPAGALDPSAAIWDLGDDPMAWAEERIGVCKDILGNGNLVSRVVREGDNFVPLRNAVQTLLGQQYTATARAIRYVGGQHTARPHRGDNSGEKPLMPVSAAKQREAVNFIVENGFSADAFTIAPAILDKLQDNKLWDWQNNLFAFGRRFDFPMTAWVGGLQNALLTQLISPMRMARLLDTQYKQSDPYPLSEMFRTLTEEIWTGNMVPSGRTAVMQRNLQRIYLNHLINLAVKPHGGTPWEATSLARLQLNRLQTGVNRAYQRGNLSDEANAHLADASARIKRALDASLISTF